MTKATFTKMLRKFRRDYNLTQEGAAKILGGVPLDTYRNWEYAKRGGCPADHTMRAIMVLIKIYEDDHVKTQYHKN